MIALSQGHSGTGPVSPPGRMMRHGPPRTSKDRPAARVGRRQSPGWKRRPPGQGCQRPRSGHGTFSAWPASFLAARPSSRSPRLPFLPGLSCWLRLRSGKVRNYQAPARRDMARKRARSAVQPLQSVFRMVTGQEANSPQSRPKPRGGSISRPDRSRSHTARSASAVGVSARLSGSPSSHC